MKESIVAALLSVALLFGGPWMLTGPGPDLRGDTPEVSDPPAGTPTEESAENPASADAAVTLQVWDGSQTVEMTMAEYLPGVVRGEMPATFEPQALAAQAVAERTYIYYQMAGGRKDNHPSADICMDHTCCNAWVSEEDARQRWGDEADTYEARIQQAVESTDGQVMLYDGVPILAVFHSSSAGVTAGSGDVWTSSLPYLTSVESPESADNVPNYYSVNAFSAGDFQTLFLAEHPEADFSGDPGDWITGLSRNGSDRVEQVTIGGVTVSGTEVRRIFSLRSACFTVDCSDAEVVFHVTGYGHGVGMSQYGANELAREGKSWQEILRWYYTGITIAPYEG